MLLIKLNMAPPIGIYPKALQREEDKQLANKNKKEFVQNGLELKVLF